MPIKNYTTKIDVFESWEKYRARLPGTARAKSWWIMTTGDGP